MIDTDLVTVPTTCPMCEKPGEVVVPAAGLRAYHGGALLQDAFPDQSLQVREQFKTGYCPDCSAKLFG